MTTTQTEKRRTTPQPAGEPSEPSEMQKMAQRVEQHHTMPMPDAKAPEQYPFPPAVVRTLWLGIAGGAVLGLLIGVLLRSNTLVLPGMEGLYSMGSFTFQFFWLMAGVGLGIVGAAVATLLVAPAARPEPEDRPEAPAENVIEVDLEEAEE